MKLTKTVICTIIENEHKHIYIMEKDNKWFVVKHFFQHDNIDIYKAMRFNSAVCFPKIQEINEFENGFEVIEDYIEGITLREKLPVASEETIMDYTLQLCEGLIRLHAKGIVHRDLKPENIIIQEDKVWIIDFDIAKKIKKNQGRDTQILGSLGYAAPEQFGFSQSDARSDVYALGNIINEMYNNQLAKEELATGKLQEVIVNSTRIDPEQRYPSVVDMKDKILKIKQNKSKYTLPGFRTNKIGNKLIAMFAYIFVLILIVSAKSSDSTSQMEHLNIKIVVILFCVLTIMIPTNYLNIQRFNPLKKHKVIGSIYMWIAFFFTCVLIIQLSFSIVS